MDELQAALDSLKAKLDEHEQGGKTIEQNLHGALTDVYNIGRAIAGLVT